MTEKPRQQTAAWCVRFLVAVAVMVLLPACASYKRVEFVVRAADTGAPVAGATLTGRAAPRGLMLTDLFRPQWTYPEQPEAVTDGEGRARLKVPVDIPQGVSFTDREGNRLPPRQYAMSSVSIQKDGYRDNWVGHTLEEWDAISSPIPIKLRRK